MARATLGLLGLWILVSSGVTGEGEGPESLRGRQQEVALEVWQGNSKGGAWSDLGYEVPRGRAEYPSTEARSDDLHGVDGKTYVFGEPRDEPVGKYDAFPHAMGRCAAERREDLEADARRRMGGRGGEVCVLLLNSHF